eukprot:11385747-Prorocentrum_lima.AAC.1
MLPNVLCHPGGSTRDAYCILAGPQHVQVLGKMPVLDRCLAFPQQGRSCNRANSPSSCLPQRHNTGGSNKPRRKVVNIKEANRNH